MALHLITGYAGQEHITSADQGAYNMGTFGEGEFVLDRGSKFAATVVTNNSITIANGEALMQGRFIKLAVGTTESVSIDNGSSGMKRKDLIVLRYSKDAGTGIESVALAVKKGTPSSDTPSDPSITTGMITDGTDLVNEMKLYRVNLDGLNIASLDTLYSLKTTMVEYMDEYQLPVADADTLGGVKVGSGLIMNNEMLSVKAWEKFILNSGDDDEPITIDTSSRILYFYPAGYPSGLTDEQYKEKYNAIVVQFLSVKSNLNSIYNSFTNVIPLEGLGDRHFTEDSGSKITIIDSMQSLEVVTNVSGSAVTKKTVNVIGNAIRYRPLINRSNRLFGIDYMGWHGIDLASYDDFRRYLIRVYGIPKK